MGLRRLFTEHPSSIGETYWQHLLHASAFAFRMIASGAACLLHAFLPFVFVNRASDAIIELHRSMVADRRTDRGVQASPN